jgi:hypothetical protein
MTKKSDIHRKNDGKTSIQDLCRPRPKKLKVPKPDIDVLRNTYAIKITPMLFVSISRNDYPYFEKKLFCQ